MANNFETNDLTGMFDSDDINQNKAVSIVAYIPVLFLIPMFVSGNSRYAKFNANQGLILTVFSFACAVINGLIDFILAWIPFIGGIITGIVSLALSIAVIVFMIVGIVNVSQGKAKKLPFIGDLFEVIK